METSRVSSASRFDFVSAATFETAIEANKLREVVPPDGLRHEDLARTIRHALRNLPAGSVIALEGEWGRGKTDVLARVARDEWIGGKESLEGGCLWLNPWQYGAADLLQPLVMELGRRAAASKSMTADVEKIKKTVGLILRASVQLGFGYAKLYAPVATPLDEAGNAIDGLLGQLFVSDGPPKNGDPIATMAASFRELVDLALRAQGKGDSARLLICVDDIDRCLPERQVALLQAFHFLLGAQARASILIAFDPELVREAVHTHYHAPNFDVDRFLDKMFHLRVPLPSLNGEELGPMIENLFAKAPADRLNTIGLGAQLAEVLGFQSGEADVRRAFCGVLQSSACANPRLVRRVADRTLLFAYTGVSGPKLTGPGGAEVFFAWLLICERFTAFRRHLQWVEAEHFEALVKEVLTHLDHPSPGIETRRLVPLLGEPSSKVLVQLLRRPAIRNAPKLGELWRSIDQSLRRAGL